MHTRQARIIWAAITVGAAVAACGSTTDASGGSAVGDTSLTDGTGADTTADGGGDANTADSAGSDSNADAGSDAGAATGYAAVVVWDKSADPAFVNGKCGSSPGADIDAIGLIRGGKLIAVGKPGTANYAASTVSTCTNKKNIASTVEGALNGHVYAAMPDDGYLSLNGGSVELQLGACKTGTTITTCDGAGDVVRVQSGDDIVLYEVDTSYKAGSSSPAAGNAYDGCICYADEYELDVRLSVGVDAGSVALPTPGMGNSADKKWNAGSTTIHVP